jgi:uptake hydrogenase large subunit
MATVRRTISVPLNRVEGDLEISAEIEDGVVVDARASATMYRGFEKILKGRGALDGLVLTPRVCGICSQSHLAAAAAALEQIAGVTPPEGAVRLRSILLLLEHAQSDLRHTFLSFAADFANPAHARLALHGEAVRRYEPFRGETALEVVRESKRLLEAYALLAGQWPHSSSVVPGGVVWAPGTAELLQARLLATQAREWYERRILGCSLERWTRVASAADLDEWLGESPTHRESDLGFLLTFGRSAGLHATGRGTGAHLSYGTLEQPGGDRLWAPGFLEGGSFRPFHESGIAEHTAHSYYLDDTPARHPGAGLTQPYATGEEGDRYSWSKAPRYEGFPAEVGPLADALVSGDPLVSDLVRRSGASTLVRQLARAVRPAKLLAALERTLQNADPGAAVYNPPDEIRDGEGTGLVGAARGGLGHWVRIRDGVIESYQIVTPTTWNASPRDSAGRRGPMEEALVGTPVADPENPVELGHVVRSFDACLVCTVHAVKRGRIVGRARAGSLP